MNLHWIVRPSQQPDCGSRTRLPPPAHKASRYGFLPDSRSRDPDIRCARDHRHPVPSRRASARGNRKPVTGKVAGSTVRADSMRRIAAFCRGDEACFHRNGGPGGRSVCASRFRLDPTHSLLLWRHLGRNLITLFSTVNTPCEKKSRSAPPRHTARTIAGRERLALPLGLDVPGDRHARKKTSFFQRFYLRRTSRSAHPRRSGTAVAVRIRHAFRQVNAAFSSFRRMADFSCRTSPIARKCANFSWRFAASKRHDARVDDVPTTPIATRWGARRDPDSRRDDFRKRIAEDVCRHAHPSPGAQ